MKMLHRIAGTKPHEGVRYHHIDAPSIRLGSGQAPVEVEVHFRPQFLDSPLRNWRLQRWFSENEQFGTLSYSPCLGKESYADGKRFPPCFDKDQHKIQGTEGASLFHQTHSMRSISWCISIDFCLMRVWD